MEVEGRKGSQASVLTWLKGRSKCTYVGSFAYQSEGIRLWGTENRAKVKRRLAKRERGEAFRNITWR